MGFLHTTALRPRDPAAGPVCRLGLATRGGSHLTEDDVQLALQHGVNFLNWPGCADALGRVIAQLGPRRREVMVCVQFEARTADEARFALQAPSATVALMAPDNRRELEEDLTVLQAKEPLRAEEYERLVAHGRRVRKHGGAFP